MKLVADTNTFLAVAMEEAEREDIIRLSLGHELMAPEVLPYELCNALTSLLKRRRLGPREVNDVWLAIQAIPVELRPIDFQAALELACRFSIYAYDAYFLDSALRYGAPLLTLDREMKETARHLNITLVE